MNDSRMRREVNRWGLHVVCLVCVWRGRHRPERDGRLRWRRCPGCERRESLRSAHWARSHQLEANRQKRALLGQLSLSLAKPQEVKESGTPRHAGGPPLKMHVVEVGDRDQPERPSIPSDLLQVAGHIDPESE